MEALEFKAYKHKANQNYFGEVIHEARLEKDMALRDFAKKLNISASYLSKLENDVNLFIPNKELLEKIALFLELNIDRLAILAANSRKIETTNLSSEKQIKVACCDHDIFD